jgi:hypothetical protein
MRSRSWSKSRVNVKEGVPGFMVALYLYEKQLQARKSMIYQRFWEEDVTRISRTVQLIPQVLRDTLR